MSKEGVTIHADRDPFFLPWPDWVLASGSDTILAMTHPVIDDTNNAESAYFQRNGPAETSGGVRCSRFVSTSYAQGTWQPDELHMAPVSGLVVSEVEAHQKDDEFVTGRISFDILGKLHAGDLTITTETIRPGRTIELVESTVAAGGRSVLRARIWRLRGQDHEASQMPPLPEELAPVDQCASEDGLKQWPGGFIQSVQARVAEDHGPGHGRGWLTSDVALIHREPSTPLARLMGFVDTANGIAPVLPAGPNGYMYPNVDLTIHLVREPVGEWLGLATQTAVGEQGLGINTAQLYDENGFFGRSEQLQTIRQMPS